MAADAWLPAALPVGMDECERLDSLDSSCGRHKYIEKTQHQAAPAQYISLCGYADVDTSSLWLHSIMRSEIWSVSFAHSKARQWRLEMMRRYDWINEWVSGTRTEVFFMMMPCLF